MHQSVQDLLSQATALPQDNMVLPPAQTTKPVSPKIPIPRRNLALPALPGPKPTAKTSQPECGHAVYAKVKPLPKPRHAPAPPALPVPVLRNEPKKGTKLNDLDISDQEPDYESCDWNQKAHSKEDSSDSSLYSTVRPLLHARRKPEVDANQEHPKTSRQTPECGYPDVPVSFKQILSNVLFKDVARATPSPAPISYEDNSDLLAEPDYYEIKK